MGRDTTMTHEHTMFLAQGRLVNQLLVEDDRIQEWSDELAKINHAMASGNCFKVRKTKVLQDP